MAIFIGFGEWARALCRAIDEDPRSVFGIEICSDPGEKTRATIARPDGTVVVKEGDFPEIPGGFAAFGRDFAKAIGEDPAYTGKVTLRCFVDEAVTLEIVKFVDHTNIKIHDALKTLSWKEVPNLEKEK